MTRRAPGRDFCALFARRSVEAMAGPRSFPRGLAYATDGHIEELVVDADSARATVQGTRPYRVRLWVDEDCEAGHACSCPVGEDGTFCKHAVALALVATGTVTPPAGPQETQVDLRVYLASRDHAELVDLLLERANQDELFDARLRLAAASGGERPVALPEFRRAIENAFATGGFVHYRDMYDYTATLHDLVTILRELLEDGDAAAAAELALHAIDRAQDALGYVDDSDGQMRGIGEELAELHQDACRDARPDPLELAAMLVERELGDDDLEVFYGAALSYAEVLGEPGLAEYRRRVTRLWEALPARGPGDTYSYDGRRSRLSHMMETLAEASGDLDATVAVLARDLSSSYQYVRIADRLCRAGRHGDALTWAEQGLEAFGTADSRVLDVVLAEYQRAGRGEDAVALAWRAFDEHPAPPTHERLRTQATQVGVWDDWREQALARLRARVVADIAATGKAASRWHMRDGSDLVTVFLQESGVEPAWAAAHEFGCSRALWVRLAHLRGAEYPAEVIPIWLQEVESAIGAKNNGGYQEAVEVIARIGTLMDAAGRGEEFAPYVAGVRVAHKPKRNLMKLFAARGW